MARFRQRGCEHYSLLGEIFSSTTATGKLHYDSTQEPLDSADERELEADFLIPEFMLMLIPRLNTKENQLLD